MSADPEVFVHPDAQVVAQAAAARLVGAMADAQRARGVAHVVLTGGGVGIATLRALAAQPALAAVDPGAVHLWWGDERYLPAGHADRNETQARTALLDLWPVPAAHVHAMPAADGPHGDDVDAAAAEHARVLAAAAGGAGVPEFDVLMLGMGPDAHVASLFPGHAGARVDGGWVVGVRDSPKPPPTRISLTFAALARAREAWVLAAGAEKAPAVALALGGADRVTAPASAVRGARRTLWLIDTAAAGDLPADI